MRVLRSRLIWLLVGLLVTAPALGDHPPAIEAAVFLSESGFNRDDVVLQYNTFVLADGSSAVEITSESGGKSARHQFSWTLPLFSDGGRAGAGDAKVDYRYQLIRGPRFGAAPRASVILPTRSAHFGDRISGLELAIPLTIAPREGLEIHTTPIARWLGGGTRELGLDASVAIALSSRTTFLIDSTIVGSHDASTTVVRPAIQVMFEVGGVRITPALALPFGDADRSVLLLFGIEHRLRMWPSDR